MDALVALWHWFGAWDARIWQAIIAGSFVAAGWLVNGRRNRLAARRLRAERLRDAHRAIFAEIDANLSNLLDEAALRAEASAFALRIYEDPNFVPLIPRERHDRIFSALESEVHVLPRVTIDPIVAYYSQLSSLSAHVEDMRGEAFRTLGPERRAAMYEDYIEMKAAALRLGRRAIRLIEVYARDGKDVAEAEAARMEELRRVEGVSSPGAVRSGL